MPKIIETHGIGFVPSDQIIFIVGNSRSGTTMMGRMLDQNSKVHTFGELHFFEQMVDATTVKNRPAWSRRKLMELLERLLTSSRDGLFSPVKTGKYSNDVTEIITEADADDPIAAYASFLKFETQAAGMTVPCEQTPRYLYQAEEILDAFPAARMICLIRDPRAVLLSQKNKWKRRKLGASNMPFFWALRAWLNYHPYTMSRMWVSASRRAKRLDQHERFATVKFEDLIADPSATLQKLSEFSSITYEPQMLEVAQVGSSSGQDRPNRLGVDASRVGAWLGGGLSKGEIALCERIAASEMKSWGYRPTGNRNSTIVHCAFMLGFGVKSAAALLVNLNRIKNLRETIERRFG